MIKKTLVMMILGTCLIAGTANAAALNRNFPEWPDMGLQMEELPFPEIDDDFWKKELPDIDIDDFILNENPSFYSEGEGRTEIDIETIEKFDEIGVDYTKLDAETIDLFKQYFTDKNSIDAETLREMWDHVESAGVSIG